MSVKHKAILSVSLIFLALSAFNLSSGIVQYNRDLQRTIEADQNEFHHVISTTTDYLFNVYSIRLRTMVENNDKIVQAFADHDRERLLQLTRPFYEKLKQENPFFEVMHFHLPDGRSFLRVHQPQLFGDDLRPIRPAIQYVHAQRKHLTGFEIGRYGPFYRVIEPVFHEGKYVGVVEIGIDARQLVLLLRNRLKVEAAAYFDKAAWSPAKHYQGGVIERGGRVLLAGKESVFGVLPPTLDLAREEQRLDIGARSYIARVHPVIADFAGKPLGGIFILQDISGHLHAKRKFVRDSLLFSSILLLASLVVLYFSFGGLIGRLESLQSRQRELIDDLTREVAERKQVELSLRDSEEKLKSMLESVGDHVLMVDRDLDIVWANEAMRRAYDNRIVGMKCYETIRNRREPCPADQCLARRVLADGSSHEDECRVASPAGEVFYRCSANAALKNEDGSPATVIEVYRDITPVKQAEEAAQRLHHRNQLLLEAAGEGIYGVDLAGNTTFVNPAALRLTGYAMEELVGRNQHAILHHTRGDGAAYPACECPMMTAMQDGQVYHVFDEVFWRRDGSSFPVEYVATPILEEGAIVGAVVVFRDVTERQQLEGQLLQSQKMEAVGRLAGGIAHDFNNLLTTILGYSELVLQKVAADAPIRNGIEAIARAGQSAAALTRQLLAFSRKQVIAMQEVRLDRIVTSIGRMVARTVGEDIRLVIHAVESCGTIKGDPGQIEQILMNLVVNARDAMPAGGSLMIETAPVQLEQEYCRLHQGLAPGRYALLSVSDTGCGMSAEVRQRLFEPFFTTKPQGKGTGLGLATVHGIVKQHNGHIFVDSEPGRGTTFKIFFPVLSGVTPAGDEPEEEGALPGGSETVLVVDDNEAVCAMVRDALVSLGYRVHTSASGEEALARVVEEGWRIDLLLTDLIMPGMNGWELSQALQVLRPAMRTLVMSGYTDKVILENGALKAGVAFIHKPVMPSNLAARVRELLDRQG
ncbi:MAG: PAS domain S-box protein [Desulfobulbaceae bacterium]|nr:PAS domain S-box protein [Desulfobulbaceae bacterium]